jgi:hypothetical protein
MFLRLLRDENRDEEWKLFFVYRGDFPTEEELSTFDGFIITGSVLVCVLSWRCEMHGSRRA